MFYPVLGMAFIRHIAGVVVPVDKLLLQRISE